MNSLTEAFWTLVTGAGGGAVIALGTFKFFGARWLENRFAARLQDLKHQQGQEIERLRFRISGLLDRSTKLNQREFEVLPEAWAQLHEAFAYCEHLLSRFRTVPDFSKMTEAHFEEALKSFSLAEWQKEEMKTIPKHERTHYYAEAIYWHELHQAKKALAGANGYLFKNGILISPEVFARLDCFAEMISRGGTRTRIKQGA